MKPDVVATNAQERPNALSGWRPSVDGQRKLIESGSHTRGVDAADFRLPRNTALRYERPDPRLAPFLTDYHVLDSIEQRAGAVDWMLPSWAAIRFILSDRPIAITLGNRRYEPMPLAALYGTTSRAMRVAAHGGVTIGIGISPIGWARLLDRPADRLRDRIVPLSDVMPAEWAEQLRARLEGSDRGPAVKALLDEFFLRQIGEENPDEPVIRALTTLIADDETHDLTAAAGAIGVDINRLRRVSHRYFGFPPKTLLIRTRFLRSFVNAWGPDDQVDYARIAPTYHDVPHFLRDANRFLGMTPKRFVAMETPYLKACLRARAAVLGAATSAS